MQLDGIHHITCITADGQANVDFYVRVLGLRLVKKTVNFDVPNAYHLYFGDETGHPGSILTFFEYPNVAPGRAGDGAIYQINWRVGNHDTLEFWTTRLADHGIDFERGKGTLAFQDPEGLGLGLVVDEDLTDAPLTADAADIPAPHRLLGFEGIRAYAQDPGPTEELLVKTLGFTAEGGDDFALDGPNRRATLSCDAPPGAPAIEGAGSVHHIAWVSEPGDHAAWRERVAETDLQVTDFYDRKYFRSIYFREPSGVLFEIATRGPGFTVDEPLQRLGEILSLPEWEEHRRAELERSLTPIRNPRTGT